MDKATEDYIRAMGKEVQGLAHDVRNADLDLDGKIEALRTLAFRAGYYWHIVEKIKESTYA